MKMDLKCGGLLDTLAAFDIMLAWIDMSPREILCWIVACEWLQYFVLSASNKLDYCNAFEAVDMTRRYGR